MIEIKNAYENNLKNISINIPKNKITSIIGVSGSGKSSLIYNVIANEAKRKEKIDSGKANCFDYAVSSKVDKIDNLPYCVTLKQRGLRETISSTIATLTNLHPLLRDEFVKDGQIIGEKGNIIIEPTISNIKNFIAKYYNKVKFDIFAIVCDDEWTNGKKELSLLKANHIEEALFSSSYDNQEKKKKTSTIQILNDKYAHTILVPILNIDDLDNYKNIAIKNFMFRNKELVLKFYIDFIDSETGQLYQKKSRQLFSFNSNDKYSGQCLHCKGHGLIEIICEDILFKKDITLNNNFINIPISKTGRYENIILLPSTIIKALQYQKVDLDQSYFDLSKEEQRVIQDIIYPKILTHKTKPSLGKFVQTVPCSLCDGTRLNYKANAVKLYNFNISEILHFTVDELYHFFKGKELHHHKIIIILESLQKATLGYLTLDRTTDTLSGGELQRLKLAIELNNDYKNLLYILDEPSTGLHPYNNYQIMHFIQDLKDKGNTIIISEHNKYYINNSDFVIELGIGSGDNGGEIIFSGNKKEFKHTEFSRKKLNLNLKNSIELIGVNANNIINENFIIPLNCLVTISGVSGSGKSTLIHKVLVPTIEQYIADRTFNINLLKDIRNIDNIESIIELTQSQIGINSRSIVATYLNIFDNIRDTYAALNTVKEFGLDKSYFSFNSNGACETCNGLGDIDGIVCSHCLGQRYKAEVLNIQYNELNIFELLNIQIDKLDKLFVDKKLKFAFEILQKLGLSHLSLGRTTPTLSGGEAQRLKLAKCLIESSYKIKKGNFLFILDEPTSGLNVKDTEKIYAIFDEILSFNNSIIIIEHNLNIIKNSDFIIDIGIGSGKNGGKNIFNGSFEELLKDRISLTAKAFNKDFKQAEPIEINKSNLLEKIYNNKTVPDCNKFYLDGKHFEIEKRFAKNYRVVTDKVTHKYFKIKNELFSFVDSLKDAQISFNPYATELFKYKKVPLSIKKDRIKYFHKLGFKVNIKDFESNEWNYRVDINNLESGYNFGNGWVTIKSQNQTYELFTRLVSIDNKIIGTPKIDEKTFNLYLNSCIYCDGKGTKQAYDINLIIDDKNKSIVESGFFHSNIKINLRNVITRFEKEDLFDLTKPYNQFSQEEQNIFLFGFREYKFLKANGKTNILSDYIEWKGIYSYIYHNLNKIKIAGEIKNSQYSEICPFCNNGFKKEVQYYHVELESILDYLSRQVILD